MSVGLEVITALIHSGLVLGCTARRGGCNALVFTDMYLRVCVFEKAVILGIMLEFHSF